MSNIGVYRYKLVPSASQDIVFFVDGVQEASHRVEVKESCTGNVLIKYLDRYGQYRFVPFNRFYEINDNPEQIGKVNRVFTSLVSAQSDMQSVGYRNKRQYSLTADSITPEEMLYLSDIFSSPRIYLYIGNGASDTASDWLEVEKVSSSNLVRKRKGNSSDVTLIISLPEWYSVTLV